MSQADLEASNKIPIYVASAVGLGLATGSVILRGIARRKCKTFFGWDDYTIVFALVSLLPDSQTSPFCHLPIIYSRNLDSADEKC